MPRDARPPKSEARGRFPTGLGRPDAEVRTEGGCDIHGVRLHRAVGAAPPQCGASYESWAQGHDSYDAKPRAVMESRRKLGGVDARSCGRRTLAPAARRGRGP